MADPINPDTTWPVDKMHPGDIEQAAGQIRTVGSNVATTGGHVAKAWAGLKKGYHAPEQDTLFGAMQPATQAATDFSTDMDKAATALETFAGEVRTIKQNVAKIRADARTFLAGIHNGQVTVTEHVVQNRAQLEMGQSTTTHKEVAWDSIPANVETNNALIRRAGDQQEQLWAAERKCANAIRDLYGAPHIYAASESNPHGYGVNEIPDNASNLPWGNTVNVKESCGDKVADGVVIDGIMNGLGGFIGFHYTQPSAMGPEQAGFSWSTLGQHWEGLGQLATGLANPATPALAFLPGPVGRWFNASTEAEMGFVPGFFGIDVFNHDPNQHWITDWNHDPLANWKNNPARTAGSVGFNVLTLAIPGPKGLGALTKAGEAARAADGAGDVANATRAADGLGDLAKVSGDGADLSKIAGDATKADLGNLGKVTDNLGDGLNGIGKTDINVPDAPNVPHDHVTIDHPNTGDHAPTDAPPAREPGHTGVSGEHPAPVHDSSPAGDASGHQPSDSSGHQSSDSSGHQPNDHGGNGHGNSDGTSGLGDGTKESPRRYEYSNPAESLHGSHEPSAGQLDHVGPSKDYTPGSPEHMTARWHEYHGNWSWDRWRDTYIRNQGHHARGVAYEQAYADTKHLSGDDWARNTSVKHQTGVDRNYDFVSKTQREAIELKSGDRIDLKQLAKDEKLSRAGWDVKYVFGKEPNASTIEALDKAGVQYELFYGDPVLAK